MCYCVHTNGINLFQIRNGVSRVLDVEAGDAVRAEEDGHDDEENDEDRDVGDRQTSKQERRHAIVAVKIEDNDRQQVGGDAEQT